MISKDIIKQLREQYERTESGQDSLAALANSLFPHVEELIKSAEECERLREEVELLKNPLPTKAEEKAFYDKAYHAHNTGCGLNCQK